MTTRLSILALIICLAGCTAGRDFAPPTPEALVLGTTTRAQILEKYGPPARQATAAAGFTTPLMAGTTQGSLDVAPPANSFVSLTYVFAKREDPMFSWNVSRRSLIFTFWNDKLVAYHFLSNFEQDSSNFDELKVAALQKGKTTVAELAQLLGPPTGRAIFPLAPPDQVSVFYDYTITDMKALEHRTKSLQLLFSADDRLVNYRFTSNVNPVPPPQGNPNPLAPPAL